MQFVVNPKNVTRLFPWGQDGDAKQWWIDVKETLSAREDKLVQGAGIPHMLQKTDAQAGQPAGEVKMGLDMGRMAIVRARQYIVGWSLTDLQGAPLPLNEDSIGELLPEVLDAIDKALDAHKAKVLEGKAQAQAGQSLPKSA